MNTLQQLFDKHHCDKGSRKHRYDRVYEPAMEQSREGPVRLLEIGTFKGESTRAFVDYFPNGEIVTIDIFTRVPAEDIDILDHPRVKWFKCDSLQGFTEEMEQELQLDSRGFDFIIDDGLHTHQAQRKTFENFFKYLNQDGKYFIEDVWAWVYLSAVQRKHSWLTSHPQEWNAIEYDELIATISQHDVKYHDLRQGYDPDTFIIEISKS